MMIDKMVRISLRESELAVVREWLGKITPDFPSDTYETWVDVREYLQRYAPPRPTA